MLLEAAMDDDAEREELITIDEDCALEELETTADEDAAACEELGGDGDGVRTTVDCIVVVYAYPRELLVTALETT